MLSQETASTVGPSTEQASRGFARVADALRGEPGVEPGTGFSIDPGLRSDGTLFAMLRAGELVVRLSERRADELVRTRLASRFYGRETARLEQWVGLAYSEPDAWLAEAREALSYARGVRERSALGPA